MSTYYARFNLEKFEVKWVKDSGSEAPQKLLYDAAWAHTIKDGKLVILKSRFKPFLENSEDILGTYIENSDMICNLVTAHIMNSMLEQYNATSAEEYFAQQKLKEIHNVCVGKSNIVALTIRPTGENNTYSVRREEGFGPIKEHIFSDEEYSFVVENVDFETAKIKAQEFMDEWYVLNGLQPKKYKYKIGWYDYEGSGYQHLYHTNQYTLDEFREMYHQATLQVAKEYIEKIRECSGGKLSFIPHISVGSRIKEIKANMISEMGFEDGEGSEATIGVWDNDLTQEFKESSYHDSEESKKMQDFMCTELLKVIPQKERNSIKRKENRERKKYREEEAKKKLDDPAYDSLDEIVKGFQDLSDLMKGLSKEDQ